MLLPEKVFLDPVNHVYYDKRDLVYASTSRFIDGFSDEFQDEMLASATAKKRKGVVEAESKKRGISINQVRMEYPKYSRGITTQEVLNEWEAKRNEASDAGTYVHNIVENYVKTGQISDEKYTIYCQFVQKILEKYHAFHSEEVLYNEEYMTAGTADIILQRTKSLKSPLDIGDYKTNWDGFTYNSKSVDQYTGKTKHNNRYFHAPINHLEKSYYTKTCLQLSKYMWMAEQKGFKPGSLFVVLLDWKLEHKPKVVHLPYMKLEIEAMLNYKK